jgi:hypothetical protein
MRKLLVLAMMAVATLTCIDAQASTRRVRTQVSTAGQSPFSRLMELERRKNAALRQMFLSR